MNDKTDLEKIRSQIDAIDEKLIDYINQRASLALKIAGYKKKSIGDDEFYRPERESQILRRVIESNSGPLLAEDLARLVREIMSACLALQQKLQVAYLGPEGTFTQVAVLKHFGHAISTLPSASIDQVFREVDSGSCNYGVVPVENSIEGVVNHTLDMLINSNLKICGEIELRIHQHLMSKLSDIKSVKRVYSHQQSLAQCRAWLNTHLFDRELIPVNSNAEAASKANEDPESAAIAGESAAELYGLELLVKNIEDEPDNTTRFLVLGKQNTPTSGDDKTSLLFSMPSKPGTLLKMLACFADHDVNMTRIESRPARIGTWEYVFFVDVDGHIEDSSVSAAVKQLKDEASMVKLLGSYPRAVL